MKGFNNFITPWDEEVDGLIGNGTTAKIKLSIYSGTNKAGKPTNVVQLESVGILDLVPYDNAARDPWF